MKLRARGLATVAVALGLTAALAAVTRGGGGLVNPDGLDALGRFFTAVLTPRLDPAFLRVVADSTLTTVAYAVLGTALSLVLGVLGGVLTSQTWWRAGSTGRRPRVGRVGGWVVGWVATRALVVLPRGVHEVVWALLLLAVLGLDPLVAVVAIGVPFGAVCAKVFSEILDESPQAPFEALRAAGAGRVAALMYGVAPLVAPDVLSYAAYRFECAIRSATVLGVVGAGGLGYQLALSFQTLRYDEIWTLLGALVLVCGLTDRWSSAVRRRFAQPTSRIAGARRRRRRWLVVPGLLLVPLAAGWLRLDLAALTDPRTGQLAGDLAAAAWPPQAEWGSLLVLTSDTLAMSVVAAAASFAGALVLALPAARTGTTDRSATPARRVGRRLLGSGVRALLLCLRAVPPPVWALLVLFVWFPGPLAGALALAGYNLGVLGRLLAEVVEDVDGRPQRALADLGASPLQVFLYAELPVVWRRFVALALYRWEVVVRDTVVVGVVGAGGLGLLLSEQLAGFDYAGTTATLLALVALTLLVDLVSALLRRPRRRGALGAGAGDLGHGDVAWRSP